MSRKYSWHLPVPSCGAGDQRRGLSVECDVKAGTERILGNWGREARHQRESARHSGSLVPVRTMARATQDAEDALACVSLVFDSLALSRAFPWHTDPKQRLGRVHHTPSEAAGMVSLGPSKSSVVGLGSHAGVWRSETSL